MPAESSHSLSALINRDLVCSNLYLNKEGKLQSIPLTGITSTVRKLACVRALTCAGGTIRKKKSLNEIWILSIGCQPELENTAC